LLKRFGIHTGAFLLFKPPFLTEKEAEYRLKTSGYNELPHQAFSGVQILLRQFKNPIFVILIAAAVVAGLFAELKQAIIIISMIALSVILGFYNEYKAERIVENLRQSVALKTLVTRNGKSFEIDSKFVVPGDLVSVNVGDMIPADMRMVKAKDLQANEATLTGESAG
jgi:Ca2+-transporting ATPase